MRDAEATRNLTPNLGHRVGAMALLALLGACSDPAPPSVFAESDAAVEADAGACRLAGGVCESPAGRFCGAPFSGQRIRSGASCAERGSVALGCCPQPGMCPVAFAMTCYARPLADGGREVVLASAEITFTDFAKTSLEDCGRFAGGSPPVCDTDASD